MEGILRKFTSVFRGNSRKNFRAVEVDHLELREVPNFSEENAYLHKPVLLKAVLENLNLSPGKVIVDCTIGGAGHAQEILKRILPGGLLIGIDWDRSVLPLAEKRLNVYGENFKLVHGNFKNLKIILKEVEINSVDGFLFDLGLSTYQLRDKRRGFSFHLDSPLDMRINEEEVLKAEDLVNYMDEDTLVKIIENNAQERFARRIVRGIVLARKRKKIERTSELVEIIMKAVPQKYHHLRIHPATRTFQALRIAVNNELENLSFALEEASELVLPRGRILVISFHSLEDRIVKNKFKRFAKEKNFEIITKKPLTPSHEEISENPQARSAKLRVIEKIR